MEFVDGGDLRRRITRGMTADEGLELVETIAGALGHAHRSGVVHRDVKDENVIINEDFRCLLIDFGSAAYFKPGRLFSTFSLSPSKSRPDHPWLRIRLAVLHWVPSPAQTSTATLLVVPIREKM